MKQLLFKVGDKVKVLAKYHSEHDRAHDYPFSFVDLMLEEFGGQIVTICSVELPPYTSYKEAKYYNGDDFIYDITEDQGAWEWHSSMFELLEKKARNKYILSSCFS